MTHMRIALQMDPLERLNMAGDSTLELARAAAEQGHELFHYTPAHLSMSIDGAAKHPAITASGHALLYKQGATPAWTLGAAATRDLSGFNVILMRQDPPFDLAYIAATHILEHLKDKVRIVNDPVGVRDAPEKLLTAHVPYLMPPTLVTRDFVAIKDFRARHKDIIIKPLFGFAGHGIFHLRENDDNLAALVETLAAMNPEPWMIQKFLPVAEHGDKRIILLDGDAVGSFRRMPAAGDMRSNMRVGGVPCRYRCHRRLSH
jgi:glutathione synthase